MAVMPGPRLSSGRYTGLCASIGIIALLITLGRVLAPKLEKGTDLLSGSFIRAGGSGSPVFLVKPGVDSFFAIHHRHRSIKALNVLLAEYRGQHVPMNCGSARTTSWG